MLSYPSVVCTHVMCFVVSRCVDAHLHQRLIRIAFTAVLHMHNMYLACDCYCALGSCDLSTFVTVAAFPFLWRAMARISLSTYVYRFDLSMAVFFI